MRHNNRSKLTINTDQHDIDDMLTQRPYHGSDNCVVIGTVARGTGKRGLLVKNTVTKQYWLWDGAYSSLDARKVNAALGIDGRVNNGGHSTKGKAGRPAGKTSDTVAITPLVLRSTAEKLRLIAERDKTSIGKVIDALAKSQP